jgi:hypothetical protein
MADLGSLGQRAQELLWWLPPWAIDLVLLAVALAIAYLVHRILYRVAVRTSAPPSCSGAPSSSGSRGRHGSAS